MYAKYKIFLNCLREQLRARANLQFLFCQNLKISLIIVEEIPLANLHISVTLNRNSDLSF